MQASSSGAAAEGAASSDLAVTKGAVESSVGQAKDDFDDDVASEMASVENVDITPNVAKVWKRCRGLGWDVLLTGCSSV